MRWLALAFVVWPVAFVLSLAGLAWTIPPAEYVGRIVMERAPFCDEFIVQTPLGYVTAIDLMGDGNVLSGAQRVSGNLYLKGPQRVAVDESSSLLVAISHFDTDWDRARDRFEVECQLLPDIAADVVALSRKHGPL
jgi:hypothetical protein